MTASHRPPAIVLPLPVVLLVIAGCRTGRRDLPAEEPATATIEAALLALTGVSIEPRPLPRVPGGDAIRGALGEERQRPAAAWRSADAPSPSGHDLRGLVDDADAYNLGQPVGFSLSSGPPSKHLERESFLGVICHDPPGWLLDTEGVAEPPHFSGRALLFGLGPWAVFIPYDTRGDPYRRKQDFIDLETGLGGWSS